MTTNKNCLNGYAIALIVGWMCVCITVQAQKAVGIYRSPQDFQNGKLTFTKLNDSSCKIRIRSASLKRKIKIKCGKTIHYLSKDSTYGYRDKYGTVFRFFDGREYTLMNPGEEIQLYKLQLSNHTKYEPAVVGYYFSRNPAAAIYQLTQRNILVVFSDNKRFTDLIEIRYRNDGELIEYDTYRGKYKLNRLLELSKN